jgi:hypothetical protein
LKKSVEERKTREQKEIEIQQLKINIDKLCLTRDKQSIGLEKSKFFCLLKKFYKKKLSKLFYRCYLSKIFGSYLGIK